MPNQNFRVKNGLEVGTGATISSGGNITAGIISATSFVGNGSQLTGVVPSGTINYANISGVSSSVVGGAVSATSLTVTGVSTFEGAISVRNGYNLNIGDNNDLRIYNDGTDSRIEETGSGSLYISGSDINIQQHSTNENIAKFIGGGAVELYYNDSKKFSTSGIGVTVTGTLVADQINVSGVVTASSFSGNASSATYSTTAGVSTSVIGGIGSITQLQVTGNASVSGNLGVGTVNPRGKLEVVGSVVADGSDIRSLSGTHLVSYSSASDVANSAKSITGFSTYRQVGVLTAGSNINSGDEFGYSVAITADGNTIFVGAGDDEIGGSSNGSGAVYVFDRVGLSSSFYQVGILTGSLASNTFDYFGASIACTPDGKTLIASAPYDESGGLMYVFDRIGNNFNQVGILSASIISISDQNFGVSIDISADGKTIVGGYDALSLPGYPVETGAVFVWERDGNTFTEVGILTAATPDTYSEFGEAVAISGDGKTIIVGGLGDDGVGGNGYGSINIFDRVGVGTTSVFNRVGVITGTKASSLDSDAFGCSVDISYDGSSIIVGDFNGDVTGITTTGTASVYDRVGDNFNLVGIFTGSRSKFNGSFGQTVVMSPDGKRMLVTGQNESVGSGFEGIVYIFERQGNTISQVGIVTGYSPGITYDIGTPWDKHLAMSADGKTIVLGAPGSTVYGNGNAGAAFVFDEVRQTYLYCSPSGVISDSSGNIRSVPQNSQSSAYILAASDIGKHVSITTGGVTVNSGIFSAGDAVSIYNNSGSNQTITQGTSVTMYLVGTATTGNRTLAQRGVATVLCVGTDTFVIMGGGLT